MWVCGVSVYQLELCSTSTPAQGPQSYLYVWMWNVLFKFCKNSKGNRVHGKHFYSKFVEKKYKYLNVSDGVFAERISKY